MNEERSMLGVKQASLNDWALVTTLSLSRGGYIAEIQEARTSD